MGENSLNKLHRWNNTKNNELTQLDLQEDSYSGDETKGKVGKKAFIPTPYSQNRKRMELFKVISIRNNS